MTEVVSIVSPAVLILVGALFLLFGYRLIRIVAVLALGGLGALWGHTIGTAFEEHLPRLIGLAPGTWMAIALGILLAVLAIPLLRAAVVLAFAMMLALVAWGVWEKLGYSHAHRLIGVAAALLLGVILGLLLFRFILITLSSAIGASLIVYGGMWLIERMGPPTRVSLEMAVDAKRRLLYAGALLVLLFMGIFTQLQGWRHRQAKAAPAE